MNYAAEAQFKTRAYKSNRKLTHIDSVFPTETMRLHHRIIDWHRKRRIKVRDADATTNLNAYLIDPKYLDKDRTSQGKDVPVTYIPSDIPVYQYSKITHNRDYGTYATTGPLAVASQQMFRAITLGFEAFTTDLLARYRALKMRVSKSHYSIGSGVLPWWRQRVRFFATALVTGGLLVAAVAFTPDKPTSPVPVSAHSNTAKKVNTASSGSNGTRGSIVSSPTATQSTTRGQNVTTTQSSLPAPSQQKLPTQQLVTNPVTNTSPTSSAPSTTTTTTPVTTAPLPTTPTTSPTVNAVTDPILTPITKTVDNVLSTQIQVTIP